MILLHDCLGYDLMVGFEKFIIHQEINVSINKNLFRDFITLFGFSTKFGLSITEDEKPTIGKTDEGRVEFLKELIELCHGYMLVIRGMTDNENALDEKLKNINAELKALLERTPVDYALLNGYLDDFFKNSTAIPVNDELSCVNDELDILYKLQLGVTLSLGASDAMEGFETPDPLNTVDKNWLKDFINNADNTLPEDDNFEASNPQQSEKTKKELNQLRKIFTPLLSTSDDHLCTLIDAWDAVYFDYKDRDECNPLGFVIFQALALKPISDALVPHHELYEDPLEIEYVNLRAYYETGQKQLIALSRKNRTTAGNTEKPLISLNQPSTVFFSSSKPGFRITPEEDTVAISKLSF